MLDEVQNKCLQLKKATQNYSDPEQNSCSRLPHDISEMSPKWFVAHTTNADQKLQKKQAITDGREKNK